MPARANTKMAAATTTTTTSSSRSSSSSSTSRRGRGGRSNFDLSTLPWRMLEATGSALFSVIDTVTHPPVDLLPRVRLQLGNGVGKRNAATSAMPSAKAQQAADEGWAPVRWLRIVRRKVSKTIEFVSTIGKDPKIDAQEKKKAAAKKSAAMTTRAERRAARQAALSQTEELAHQVDWTSVALPAPIAACPEDNAMDSLTDSSTVVATTAQNDAEEMVRIKDLEGELAALRAQIAAVMSAQASGALAPMHGSASGTASFSASAPNPTHFNAPAPAPAAPAPPPMMMSQAPAAPAAGPTGGNKSPRRSNRNILRPIDTNSSPSSRSATPTKKGFAAAMDGFEDDGVVSFRTDEDLAVAHNVGLFSMADVASGAARGALRSIEQDRSPGGTPTRKAKRALSPSRAVSTADVIAIALARKFKQARQSDMEKSGRGEDTGANVRRARSPRVFDVYQEETWGDQDSIDW